MKRAVLLVLVALSGCQKTTENAPPSPSATTVAAAPRASAAPAGVDAGLEADVTKLDAAAPGDPYAELTPLADLDRALDPSDRVLGFSKDDRYLGFEVSTCDPCPSEFHFIARDGARLDFKYLWDPGDDSDAGAARKAKQDALVEAKLAEIGAGKGKEGRVLRGPFPYPDLVFATRSEQEGRGAAILVGAHVPGGPPVFPIRIHLGARSAPGRRRDPLFSRPPRWKGWRASR